jgi:hypothetical protein
MKLSTVYLRYDYALTFLYQCRNFFFLYRAHYPKWQYLISIRMPYHSFGAVEGRGDNYVYLKVKLRGEHWMFKINEFTPHICVSLIFQRCLLLCFHWPDGMDSDGFRETYSFDSFGRNLFVILHRGQNLWLNHQTSNRKRSEILIINNLCKSESLKLIICLHFPLLV